MLTGRPAAAFALAMSSRSLEHEVNSWQQRPHHHTVRLNQHGAVFTYVGGFDGTGTTARPMGEAGPT